MSKSFVKLLFSPKTPTEAEENKEEISKEETSKMAGDDGDLLAPVVAAQTVAELVGAVAVKLPTFWRHDPEVWFVQTEAQFATKKIVVDQTKYEYLLASIDSEAAKEVRATILAPGEEGGRYMKMKKILIDTFGESQTEKDSKLLRISGLGDRKPTSLLRHMRSLNVDMDTLFRHLFLSHLPAGVRRVLVSQDFKSLEDMAKQADRIVESDSAWNQAMVVAAALEDPAIQGVNAAFQDGGGGRRKREQKRGGDARFAPGELCYFHNHFGDQAFRCKGNGCAKQNSPLATRPISRSGNANAGR